MLYSVIKYFERSVWNIGFIKCEPGELLEGKKKIERVQWLKHSYKDRFFADPFFLSVTEERLEVLVEEYLYKTRQRENRFADYRCKRVEDRRA